MDFQWIAGMPRLRHGKAQMEKAKERVRKQAEQIEKQKEAADQRYAESMGRPSPTKVKGAADKETMDKIRQIGNTIHKSIEIETDTPALHEDKKMPILDLKVWAEIREDEEGKKTSKRMQG